MRLFVTLIMASLMLTASSQSFLPGYHTKIAGEDLSYHAPQPDAPVSLLVRSEDSARFIEWESVPLPVLKSYSPPVLPSCFLMLAGIDVNPGDPHHWKVFVNDREMFTISSPLDTIQKTLTWPGPDGSSLVFKTKEVDKYGDFMGYLYCTLPASMLEAGKPVRFKVVGESALSRTWFMVFKYETTDQVRLEPEQAVMRGENGNYQVLRAEIVRYADPVEAKITVAGQKLTKTLNFGYNVFYLPVPQINTETNFDFVVKIGKKVMAEKSFSIQPVTQRTIYLLHHSHNDIGYTHVQDEVEKMQWHNLERAIALGDSTKNYPEGAQFKWCTEVMWAVESWYEKSSPEQKQAFREAVKAGQIELNGLFANELTSLCGPEELDRLLEAGRRISRECGVELNSAMITDIPGWSWAIVPALAHSGVKYLSLGTNRGDRIGDIIKEWGDKPFYWVSPSGKEKVLCWVHGEGYSLFHTGLAYSAIRKRLQEDLVFGYMKQLQDQHYPYEEVMLRYNIGSDNGPVDETLPEAVREWNEKYVTPTVIISTVGEAFSAFEKKYGSELPNVAGDITCYWEDGAYSTARETIQNRHNASRMVQAEALWAMYNPAGYPEKDIRAAWRNVLLFDEHTWGSWNSISEPEVPFTRQQWDIKKSYAAVAEKQSRKLFFDAMTSKVLGPPSADAVEVINTCGWTRSGLVTISGGPQPQQIVLSDYQGNPVSTQLLSDGSVAFIAKDIPALGSKIYKITTPASTHQIAQSPNRPIAQSPNRPIAQSPNRPIAQSPNRPIFETARFILALDTATGAISSLIWKQNGHELVDHSQYSGLNEYLYVEGRMPDDPHAAKMTGYAIVESGPLLTVIKIDGTAPGCKSYSVYFRIIEDLDIVEIIDELDREKVYTPEAVHVAFPVDLPGGTMRYDLAYGYCRPEKDQLPGANMNFLAMEHWLDISNDQQGLTVICPDAPLFEAGKLTMDEKVCGWRDSIPPTRTFFSYVMNNYWETNYAATQEGSCTFRYVLMPHDGFDASVAEKESIGQQQPLLTRKGGGWQNEKKSLLVLQNPDLIITALKPIEKGGKLLVSVYNSGSKEEVPEWGTNFKEILVTDPDGLKDGKPGSNVKIQPAGIRYFKVSLP